MIYVILLEPVTPGNIGAVARAMKNFSFDKLVLINPHCDYLGPEARNRAKHAQDVLENAEVIDFFIVDDYDYLVATTARLGTDYNINRSPLKPEELAAKLRTIDPKKKIGLVIGRETHGLFNEEISRCDFIVTVPTESKYPTLNISHSVAVILYELHKKLATADITSHITPIGKQEKDQILRMFDEIFNSMRWETAEKKETQQKLWKKLIGKAMLTKREAYGVMGFLRKVLYLRKGAPKKKAKPAARKKAKAAKSSKGIIRKEPPAKKKTKAVRSAKANKAGRSTGRARKALGRGKSAGHAKPARQARQARKGSTRKPRPRTGSRRAKK